MRARLLRLAILAGMRFRDWPLVRLTRLSDAMRWIGRRLQPWMARTAFDDAIHDVNGVQMKIPPPVDSEAGSSEYHMALGTYEERELGYVLAHLRPGDTFLDVGAHIGYFTLPAAKAVGDTGRVIAIEPSPASAHLLRENAEMNGLGWITVVEAAATDHDGSENLFRSPKSAMWNRILPTPPKEGMDTISVSARTIDSILAESGWPSVGGIKIDCEGAELDVIRGSTSCLARNPGAFLVVEMQGRMRLEISLTALHLLEGLGYQFGLFERGAAPTPATISTIAAALEAGHLINVVAERQVGRTR